MSNNMSVREYYFENVLRTPNPVKPVKQRKNYDESPYKKMCVSDIRDGVAKYSHPSFELVRCAEEWLPPSDDNNIIGSCIEDQDQDQNQSQEGHIQEEAEAEVIHMDVCIEDDEYDHNQYNYKYQPIDFSNIIRNLSEEFERCVI